ncbi:MAG: hypothetical protein JO325_06725 [Solirubrobacterales bacterium]|nr:hypothetical protein [Solirubrobacterales bacterium]
MRFAILLFLAGAGIAVAGCGSSSSSSYNAGSTGPKDTAASDSQGLKFAQCMRSHGVPNFPDPSGGALNLRVQQSPNGTNVNGVQVNGPAFQSAMNACRSYLPNGGHPTAAQAAQAKTKALAMARCMRSHGVPNFPDPTFQNGPGGGIGVRIGGAGINPNSPAFEAAAKDCGSIFGGAGPVLQKPAG